jgi:hypothetical protein
MFRATPETSRTNAISGTNLDWSNADPSFDCDWRNQLGQRTNKSNAEMLVFFNFIRTPRIFRSDYANNKAAVAQGVISNRPNSVAPRTARGTGRFVVLKLTELRRSVRSENKSVEGMRDSFGENTDEERDRISRQTGLRWSIAR